MKFCKWKLLGPQLFVTNDTSTWLERHSIVFSKHRELEVMLLGFHFVSLARRRKVSTNLRPVGANGAFVRTSE